MTRKHASRIVPIAAVLTLALGSTGRAQETGKKVGERLDEVGRGIKGGLNRAGNAARDQFARAKTSVQNMGVESRVYGRIHWDKALHDAPIELTVTSEGVVTLTGSVVDAKAKRRAMDLTTETVGVTKAVDALTIRPATTTTAP